MKELKQLIEKGDYLQAKLWIINNRERIEEIAGCLLEEIEDLEKRPIQCEHFGPIADLKGNQKWGCIKEASENVLKAWNTVKDSRTRGEKATQELDDIAGMVNGNKTSCHYEWKDGELTFVNNEDPVVQVGIEAFSGFNLDSTDPKQHERTYGPLTTQCTKCGAELEHYELMSFQDHQGKITGNLCCGCCDELQKESEELEYRNRLINKNPGGIPGTKSLIFKALCDIPGVVSVEIKENQLCEFECIIEGGDDEEIVKTIHKNRLVYTRSIGVYEYCFLTGVEFDIAGDRQTERFSRPGNTLVGQEKRISKINQDAGRNFNAIHNLEVTVTLNTDKE